jgi:hypothetical protein
VSIAIVLREAGFMLASCWLHAGLILVSSGRYCVECGFTLYRCMSDWGGE